MSESETPDADDDPQSTTFHVRLEGDNPQAFEQYLESLYDDHDASIAVERIHGADTVDLPTDAVDDALEDMESAMAGGEIYLSHDETRPSGSRMAYSIRDAYQTLIGAHPGYELTEGDDADD